ncbi:MAG: hypothetical protein NW226_17480 [Microscillaceae bacterium]|nr:hypothetical protein [Microscillaceae bacterium]
MKTIQVEVYQNVINVALQHYGSQEGIVKLCLDNDLELTEIIHPGRELLIDESKVISQAIVSYYQAKGIIVATGTETDAINLADCSFEFSNEFGGEFSITVE